MEKRIIEIDGMKVEIDLESARRIDTFRIGDNVRVLEKTSNPVKVKNGIITAFNNFKDEPCITVAVFDNGDYWTAPSIKFIYIHSGMDNEYEIVLASEDEIKVSGEGVVERFEQKIFQKQQEVNQLREQLEYFKAYFMKQKQEVTDDTDQ